MHFQLFLPDRKGADPAHLDAVGLETLRDGALMLQTQGPGGADGMLLAWGSAATRIGYRPESQTWQPAAADGAWPAERYWIGIETDQPPAPAELARPYQTPGCWVELGDGAKWLLPRPEELPRDLILADDGSPRFAVQRRYHAFWIETLRWRELLATETQFDGLALARLVLQGLAVNYRITLELAMLRNLFVLAGPSHPRSVTRAVFALLGPGGA